jgi:hypothetical protein
MLAEHMTPYLHLIMLQIRNAKLGMGYGLEGDTDRERDYLAVDGRQEEACEISSSHGGKYNVQSCLLGCTAM